MFNIGCNLLSCFLQQCEDKWGHLCALADFSLALTESIQEINKHSFNNFELRIGELQLEVEASLSQVSLFYQPLPCPGHQSRKLFLAKCMRFCMTLTRTGTESTQAFLDFLIDDARSKAGS